MVVVVGSPCGVQGCAQFKSWHGTRERLHRAGVQALHVVALRSILSTQWFCRNRAQSLNTEIGSPPVLSGVVPKSTN